ncbi:ABC transporter ATP-binding protein [Saxibacter everestensis]|uniref:ABC transporter ATP-binding protein n=2 Tax=Saxibacter everestensis TaxID=2909229 RepID=A0ABY8QYK1_9MICO|nr:ABC transporter ATP-binding protein [Brevibacteriaceae bacterium ZFBP1038]
MGGPRQMSPRDTASKEKPPVENLGRRVWSLFDDYRRWLVLTALLILVGAGLSVLTPFLTQAAFDRGLFPPDGTPNLRLLAILVAGMILVPALTSVVAVARTYFTTRVGNRVMADLRGRLFAHLEKMELGFFTGTRTGVIQSRLANDVGGVQGVLTDTASSILSNAVTVLAAVVAMFFLSWQLTVISLVLLPFLVLLQVRVGRRRRALAAKAQESLSEMTAITQEALSVSGIVLAKVFNQQGAEVERYSRANEVQARLQIKQQMAGQWFFAAVQTFVAVTPAVVYLVAGYMISGGVDLTAGTLVAFTTLQARLMQPVVSLLRVSLDVQTSMALFARIFEYLDLKPAITEPEDPVVLDEREVRGRVTFDDVSFRYPGAASVPSGDRPLRNEGWALQHINIDVRPGQLVAFVGPSGAGKTTLSYLIPRLYDVSAGRMLLDGHDVRELSLDSLFAAIGMVTQETYLFHASIRDNLRYAKPDADDDELIAAAKAANIHERIITFDDGYDTLVGERGYRLSGGEKQRMAIARVLLKDPKVLILDEATSALDTGSERLVQQALDQAMAGRTTVAIAHRLSTILKADLIYVIDEGQVKESGTHQELLELGGMYAWLYSMDASFIQDADAG